MAAVEFVGGPMDGTACDCDGCSWYVLTDPVDIVTKRATKTKLSHLYVRTSSRQFSYAGHRSANDVQLPRIDETTRALALSRET